MKRFRPDCQIERVVACFVCLFVIFFYRVFFQFLLASLAMGDKVSHRVRAVRPETAVLVRASVLDTERLERLGVDMAATRKHFLAGAGAASLLLASPRPPPDAGRGRSVTSEPSITPSDYPPPHPHLPAPQANCTCKTQTTPVGVTTPIDVIKVR